MTAHSLVLILGSSLSAVGCWYSIRQPNHPRSTRPQRGQPCPRRFLATTCQARGQDRLRSFPASLESVRPCNLWSYENPCASNVNQRVVRRDWTPPIQINLVLARS